MPGGLVVRTGGPYDVQSIHDLLNEFNGEALPPEALARRLEQTRGLETVFVCEREGLAAGLLVLRIVPTLSDPEDWAEITEMYVRPAFRRQGVGTALAKAAIEHSLGRGCTEMHLLMDPENHAACAFYEAMGFVRDSCEMRRRV
jgi:ribosomal protein S18 acetylase RimI-like enzyme